MRDERLPMTPDAPERTPGDPDPAPAASRRVVCQRTGIDETRGVDGRRRISRVRLSLTVSDSIRTLTLGIHEVFPACAPGDVARGAPRVVSSTPLRATH